MVLWDLKKTLSVSNETTIKFLCKKYINNPFIIRIERIDLGLNNVKKDPAGE